MLDGPLLLAGAVMDMQAAAIEIAYADGTAKRLRLRRVGSPISAAFFLYELPRDRLATTTQPRDLRAIDSSGRQRSHTSLSAGLFRIANCSSLS